MNLNSEAPGSRLAEHHRAVKLTGRGHFDVVHTLRSHLPRHPGSRTPRFDVICAWRVSCVSKSDRGDKEMRAVTGVFASRADAENAARKLESLGLAKDRITLLFPGQDAK